MGHTVALQRRDTELTLVSSFIHYCIRSHRSNWRPACAPPRMSVRRLPSGVAARGYSHRERGRGPEGGMNFVWCCPICCSLKGVSFLFKLKISHLHKTAPLVALITVFVTPWGPSPSSKNNSPITPPTRTHTHGGVSQPPLG